MWFTVEKIDADTYVISEYKHWEETHCYLLIGANRSLLIDTGLGVANIKEIVDRLTDKPVTVITTHTHYDHIGGHKYFDDFYVHEEEAGWINGEFPLPLEYIKELLIEEPCDFPADFDISEYQIFQGKPTRIVKDNDTIDLGNRIIQIIHTPGHSPGHICLYEKERRYLYTGDLIYKGKLTMFFPTSDPHIFMDSITKITKIDVDKILPAHFQLDIETSIIQKINQAFIQLKTDDVLKQGAGIFEYTDFQIHL